MLSILIPFPTSLPLPSLWVFPVHSARALVSCIHPGLVICFTLDNIHVSMLFSQNIPPSPSPTESKSLFCTSVSLFLFCIQGYHCHLSFFFIHFYQLEANYFTTLQWFLSYIEMNQPWSYMYSPSQSPLSPSSPPDSSGSSQCTRPKHLSHASNLGW